MKQSILVVDDNEINLSLITRILNLGGFEVFTARNGQDAIQQVTQHVPDLAILDVMMPDMDGYELCRSLRKPPINARFPIVMLTAMSDQRERTLALAAGANDLWGKPFEMDTMRGRIEAMLKQSK